MRRSTAAFLLLVGCGSAPSNGGPAAPAPTPSSTVAGHVANAGPKSYTPEQVCERLRRVAVRAGAKGPGMEHAIAECQNDLVELRGENPRAFACESRCMMIAPGADAINGCEDLCDDHADESCVDMRKEDPTLGDDEIAACRERVNRLQDTVDEKTILCGLGCTQMADAMVEMDGCFRRCL